jgi:hypothetical protein
VRVKTKVSDHDHGWKDFLAKFLGAAPAQYAVYVGTDMEHLKSAPVNPIVASNAHETPMPVGSDGTEVFYPYIVHEGLGALHYPRPFIADTCDAHDNYRAELKRLGEHILKSKGDPTLTAVANLRLIGKQVVGHIRQTIIGMGSIQTGRMINSISVLRVGPVAKSAEVGVVAELGG